MTSMDKSKPQNQFAHHHHPFQVLSTPQGLFPLFSKTSDSYIYEKKFYCDLPKSIIPPKMFHYPFSLENFCKTDLLTMSFDLKKNNEILTDPKLNTSIHQDFINNSLELIAPGTTTVSNTEKTKELRQKLIDIVDRKEEQVTEKKASMKPFYLRTSTYLRSSLNVKAETPYTQSKSKQTQKSQSRIVPQNIKSIIEQSFKDIDTIKVGVNHPYRKGVTAKKVYDVLPMEETPTAEYYQYIFPIDPIQEINVGKNVKTPNKFLIKKDSIDQGQNEILSLYKKEQIKKENEKDDINMAEFYSHEKDYMFNQAKEYELFNRYLIFMDNEKNTAKFASLDNKYTLKKYKKIIQTFNDDNEDEYAQNFLSVKRERDIVVVPKEIDEKGIKARNEWYKSYGFSEDFKPKTIGDVNYEEIEEMKKELKSEEEQEEKPQQQEENEEEEENYFGEEGSDRNSGKEGSDDNLSQHSENKEEVQPEPKQTEEPQKEPSIKDSDDDEDDDDALFSEEEEDKKKIIDDE